MKTKCKTFLLDGGITLIILSIFFFLSLTLHLALNAQALIPPLFVLAVFLVSLFTRGYGYGVFAALAGVLAVNFAFTFPYFSFNFKIHENMISAAILLVVTTITSTLTTIIKRQEKVRLAAEKEKLRADLLRAVSHDLRTPLTAIYGAASTIIENYDAIADAQKQDILGGIQNDSRWLIRMVENLLSVTRLDAEGVQLIKSPVVLEELVDTVLSKFKKNNPGQAIDLSMPEDFIMIAADAMLIKQVLLNLLENAVQHAKGMTQLRLSVHVEENKAVFEVIDNGCGMEKEKLKSVFSGYYTGEEGPTDNQKRCMGIGLSVCAAIIRAHGGEIKAENRRKGGMIFRFALEIEEEADA